MAEEKCNQMDLNLEVLNKKSLRNFMRFWVTDEFEVHKFDDIHHLAGEKAIHIIHIPCSMR